MENFWERGERGLFAKPVYSGFRGKTNIILGGFVGFVEISRADMLRENIRLPPYSARKNAQKGNNIKAACVHLGGFLKKLGSLVMPQNNLFKEFLPSFPQIPQGIKTAFGHLLCL